MSSPEPARSPHPARAAGLALLGVAALALVIGVVSLFTGGDDPDPGAQPPSSQEAPSSTDASSPAATEPSAPQSSTTAATSPPAATSTAPSTAPTTATPPQAGGTTANPANPPVAVPVRPPVRVYNNSTIAGLAAKASDDVRRSGWEVAETGNYSQGQIPTTTVYFRPGTDEEASARQLAATLRAEVKPRFDGIQSAQPGIIVIVTNDYQGPSGKI